MKKLVILIPCFNEERGLLKVLPQIPYERLSAVGYETAVIVIDNKSTDRTNEVGRKNGAQVIYEAKKGKGYAIRTGFQSIMRDTDIVVMLDGDGTYKASEIPRLIEPIDSYFCDVVVGSRLGGKSLKNSFKTQNRVANWFYTFLVRTAYKANITDVLSGFFAWRASVITEMEPFLESDGFSIEMEMITKMKKLGFSMYSVPITYDERIGDTKLRSVSDGIKILISFFKYLSWSPTRGKIGIAFNR
ncbi:MAG TPA: glycosyltransferase [Patescibacteria group bacterium]|nr:glycosyltransferase [Patescibacteria group bacterium]